MKNNLNVFQVQCNYQLNVNEILLKNKKLQFQKCKKYIIRITNLDKNIFIKYKKEHNNMN